jgi:hypothetical protein
VFGGGTSVELEVFMCEFEREKMKKKVRVRVHASLPCKSNMYKLNIFVRVCTWVGRVCMCARE